MTQTRIHGWIDVDNLPTHDHAHDVLYEMAGLVPPCKRKPGEPGYEPADGAAPRRPPNGGGGGAAPPPQ